MMEWEIRDDDSPLLLPEAASAEQRPSRGWRGWLLLLLLGLLLAGGALWREVHDKDRLLRQALTETIEAEARVLAVGEREQLETLLDPAAPFGWRHRYQSQRAAELPGLPRLQTVRLEPDGRHALVEIVWPLPDGAGDDLAPTVEQRAYRLVGSRWRRTPLALEPEQREQRRSAHFALEGAATDLDAIGDGGTHDLRLEALYEEIDTRWPRGVLRPENAPLHVLIQPHEFEPVTLDLFAFNTPDQVLANSPRLAQSNLTIPLSAGAQYRLQLTQAVVARLLPDYPYGPGLPPTLTPAERLSFDELAYQLRAAVARQWALTPAERVALRNQWRAALGGAWQSPFEGEYAPWPNALWPATRDLDAARFARSEAGQRALALSLLLEYLSERDGDTILYRLAQRLPAIASNSTLAELIASVTGEAPAALDASARAWALAPER